MVRKDTRAKTDTAKEQKDDTLSRNRVRGTDEDWVGPAIERADIFGSKIGSADTDDRRKVNVGVRRRRREQQSGTDRGENRNTSDPNDEVTRRIGRQAKVSADSKEEELTQEGAARSTEVTVCVESAVPGEKTSSRVSPPSAVAGRLDRAELRNARAFVHTPGSAFRPISDRESPRYFFQSHGPASETAMSNSSTATTSNRTPVRATSVSPHLGGPVRPANQNTTLAPSAHAPNATSTDACAPKPAPHAECASPTLSFRNSAPINVPTDSVSATAAPTPAQLTTATHSRCDHGIADHGPYSNAGLHERSAKSEEAERTFVPILPRPSRDPTLREALELSSTSSSDAGSHEESDVSEVARPPVPFAWHRQRDPLRVALELSSTSSSDAGSHEGSDMSEVARPHVSLARRRQRSSLHEAVDLSSSDRSSVTLNDLSHKVTGYRISGSTTVSSSSALPQAGVAHLPPQSQGPPIAPRDIPVVRGNTTDHSPASSSEAPPVASAPYPAPSSNAPESMAQVKEPTSASSVARVARLATPNPLSSVDSDSTAGSVAPPLSARSAFRRHTPSVPNPIVTTSSRNHTSSIVDSASERRDVAERSLRPSSTAAARLVTRDHNYDELSDNADSRVGGEGIWERAKATLTKYELKYGRSCSHGDSLHEDSEHQSSNASTISSSGLSCEGAPAPDVHDVSDDGAENPSKDEWTRGALAHADIYGRGLEEGSPRSDSQHEGSEGEMGRERKGALASDVHDESESGDPF